MAEDTYDVKKVVPRLGGYRYEFAVGALRLLDLIEGKADKIEFETASDPEDFFDDIKVFQSKQIHHYQVKWGLLTKSIRLEDFVNISSNLYLLKLYQTCKTTLENFSTHKHIFHVYSSKEIAANDPLYEYLETVNDEEKQFSDNKNCSYRLNSRIKKLIKTSSEPEQEIPDDIDYFFKSLIVEVNQPKMPASDHEEMQIGNPIKNLLLEKISYRLGLDEFPHHLRPIDVLAQLMEESYDSAVRQRPITRNELAAKIGIQLNLIPIPQNFPFDREHYINTPKYLEQLVSKFNTSSGKLIGVVGPPGSGKSHLLTSWSNTVLNSGICPIMYYCFIGNELHPDLRVTQNQLLQDLISSILKKYPNIGSVEDHSLLAATPERLNNLLLRLGRFAKTKNQIIPIIIDGLDHVIRVRERYSDIMSDHVNILDFLKNMNVPEGIVLIIGSQQGPYLNDLQRKFGADSFFEINGFTEEESKSYLAQFEITTATVSNDKIESVIKKSAGLPLLLAYSVQANQSISLDKRLSNFEKISNKLPETHGNIKTYYDWIWEDISSKPFACHYAKLLALIDFPATEDLLENVISESLRLGNNLEKCLSPLSSIIFTSKEGISLFHDSFGAYIRSYSDFSAQNRQWYFENLYHYFKKIGIHSNDLTHTKGINFAFKAQLYDEILNTISLDFIDVSIKMAFPKNQIISQIDFAIKSAVHAKNIPLLVQNCVLRKYTEERLELNFPVNDITKLLIQLKKNAQLQRLIFSNNTLNVSLGTTIDLLSLCLENKINLPYRDIMTAWRIKVREDSENAKEELKYVDRKSYVKVITKVYGLNSALDWIEKNKEINFNEEIFEAVGKFASTNDVENLMQRAKGYNEYIIILNTLLSVGDRERAREIVSNILEERQYSTPYIINTGIELGVRQDLLEKECRVFVSKQPGTHSHDEEISELYQLEESVKILSYCEKTDDLEATIKIIKSYPLTAARLIQEMMFLLAVTEGRIYSRKPIVVEAEKIFIELMRFVNHNTDDGVKPRDFDCTGLQHVTKYVLKKLVRLYLIACDKPDLEKLIKLIRRLNHKFEWYAAGCTWIFVSTEHMISCFVEVMNKYPDNDYVKQQIIEAIESDEIPAYTGNRVDYFLKIARIYCQYGMIEDAERTFNNAILATHAYGYRKDMFLDEIHDTAIYLNKTNPSKSLDRAEEILKLTEYLWRVTDGAETKFIPANVSKELLRLKAKAGLQLLKQFSDSYTLATVECLPFAISHMENAPLPLRWKLITCANYENNESAYNNQNWITNMKFELVKVTVKANNKSLAKEIMENIREQITNEFNTCEQKWAKTFQFYAAILQIKDLDLTGKSLRDSYLVDFKIKPPPNIIKNGSVKEIIKQFEKLDKKEQYDAKKDIELIFETKIQTMSEDELDRLTDFLSKIGTSDSTCGNLLEKIALKYEDTNSEKFLKIMLLAFDTYGWIGYGYPSIISWLTKAYNVNSQKTMDFVLESFAKFSVESYGPHGSIRCLAEFLYFTNQIDILENLYRVLYAFCKTFFRTYTEDFDDYRWLRGSKFEIVNDAEIIYELIRQLR